MNYIRKESLRSFVIKRERDWLIHNDVDSKIEENTATIKNILVVNIVQKLYL